MSKQQNLIPRKAYSMGRKSCMLYTDLLFIAFTFPWANPRRKETRRLSACAEHEGITQPALPMTLISPAPLNQRLGLGLFVTRWHKELCKIDHGPEIYPLCVEISHNVNKIQVAKGKIANSPRFRLLDLPVETQDIIFRLCLATLESSYFPKISTPT